MEAKIDEVENEAQSLLSQRDYEKLLTFFKATSDDEILLQNHYFDTMIGMKIVNQLPPGTTLRLRENPGGDLLQFKFPIKKGVKNEYKDELDNDTSFALFSSGIIPVGNVRAKLEELGIMESYTRLGALTVYRVQVITKWTDAKVFLDRSVYPDSFIDYRLEVESDSIDYSENILMDILGVYSIEKIEAVSKFETFLEHI